MGLCFCFLHFVAFLYRVNANKLIMVALCVVPLLKATGTALVVMHRLRSGLWQVVPVTEKRSQRPLAYPSHDFLVSAFVTRYLRH